MRTERLRLGDCWIEGCMRDAFLKVTLRGADGPVTGLLCDEHAAELQQRDGNGD